MVIYLTTMILIGLECQNINKIFEIFSNGTNVCAKYTSATGTVLPNHRGLFITTGSSAALNIKLYNLEHTSSVSSLSTLVIPINTTILLPVQVKFYDVVSGGSGAYVFGLL